MIEACFWAIEPLLGTRTACLAVGRSRATHYRRSKPGRVTPGKPRPAPANKLTGAEVDAVLAALRSERFVDRSPDQVYFSLLDEGTYIASVSSFYRILRANAEVRERRRQATHPAKKKPELVARGPNECWSWDISKLKGSSRRVRHGGHRHRGRPFAHRRRGPGRKRPSPRGAVAAALPSPEGQPMSSGVTPRRRLWPD